MASHPRCWGDHTPTTDLQRNASDTAAVTDPHKERLRVGGPQGRPLLPQPYDPPDRRSYGSTAARWRTSCSLGNPGGSRHAAWVPKSYPAMGEDCSRRASDAAALRTRTQTSRPRGHRRPGRLRQCPYACPCAGLGRPRTACQALQPRCDRQTGGRPRPVVGDRGRVRVLWHLSPPEEAPTGSQALCRWTAADQAGPMRRTAGRPPPSHGRCRSRP